MAIGSAALAGSGFLIASTVLAQAAEPIKLRVADSFPKGHYLVKLVLEPWMEEVKSAPTAPSPSNIIRRSSSARRPTC